MKPQTSSPTSNVTPVKRNSPGVRTTWTVEHSCGHTADHDLSNRPADKRAAFARWLAGKDCSACWQNTRTNDSASKQEWLAARRAEEQAAAAAWAAQFDMPPLEGPAKALPWGERCRHRLVTAAYDALVAADGGWDEADWAAAEDKARQILRAGWWIDQRDAEPADLPELLNAATADDRGTENPYR